MLIEELSETKHFLMEAAVLLKNLRFACAELEDVILQRLDVVFFAFAVCTKCSVSI